MVPNKTLDNYIKRIANKDKAALGSLFEETKASVYAYALAILKNKSLAEEVLQETYINIYENAYLYKTINKPLSWILTITKHNALMKIRKERNNVSVENPDNILNISDNKESIYDRLYVSYLFKYLSEEERNIIILHAVAGLKHHEIAKVMELPLGTVLSKYNRAIKRLKKEEGYE